MAELHITVEEDSELGDDGYAVFRLLGQAGHQDRALRILVSRDGADGCLGPQGWGPRCYGFRPRNVQVSGNDLLLRVGPEIVNPVEEYTLVHVRIPPLTGEAMVRWPALQPTADIPRIEIEPDAWESDRFGDTPPAPLPAAPADAAAELPAPVAPEPEVVPEPEPEPEPEPAAAAPARPGEPRFTFGGGTTAEDDAAGAEQETVTEQAAAAPERRRVRLWLALLLMILMLLIGLGYHFADRWLERDEPVADDTLPAVEEEAEAPAIVEEPEAPDETDASAETADETTAPLTADQRLDEARAALARGDNEVAIRLLRENEREGHGASMAELAQLVDSIGFEPGLFSAPNDSEAVRLYGAACAAGDESAAVPLAALRDHLTVLAEQGDVAAQTIVGDAGRLPAALAACGL
jgi:hypothetical protein